LGFGDRCGGGPKVAAVLRFRAETSDRGEHEENLRKNVTPPAKV
jgi:hypothetical protein